jgi:hypothetical protein
VTSAKPGHATSRPWTWPVRGAYRFRRRTHWPVSAGALLADNTAEAEEWLGQARAIFQRIGSAETADVLAELDALHATPHPASTSP